MFLTVRIRQLLVALLIAGVVAGASLVANRRRVAPPVRARADIRGQVLEVIDRTLRERAQALLAFDDSPLLSHYDLGSIYGRWALAHEQRRLRYLRAWADKRHLKLLSADASFRVTQMRLSDNEAWASVMQSTRLGYVYDGDPSLEKHLFGIGTRHAMQLVRSGSGWIMRRDWYTDPLDEDSLIPEVTPADVAAAGGILEGLARLQANGAPRCSPPGVDDPAWPAVARQAGPDGGSEGLAPSLGLWLSDSVSSAGRWLVSMVPFIAGAQGRRSGYDRDAAVRYARTYCGVAWGCGNGGRYNPSYRDYTDIGGDCTNFASQVVHAGGVPMDSSWFYRRGAGGSRAWVQTLSFADHLLAMGRARLLARGRYADVMRATEKFPKGAVDALEPGDLIGYQEKGRIVHFAAVVGRDFRGYVIVNSHTADRNQVPWDVGWDQATIFWLFRMQG